MTTLESLARTVAAARHGTDAMWANYLGAAEAVEKMMGGWMPIETAPKDGSVITLRGRHHHNDDGREVVREGHYDTGGYTEGWETERGSWFIPTHWMKLPEPPK